MGYVYGHRNSHRTSNIWAPPSEPPRPLRPRGMLSVTSRPSLTRCWRGHGGGWHPADPHRAEAAIGRSGAMRKATMAIWCVAFCGMQWRAIGQLCDIPFNTLFTLFARWTRLGLWRRLLDRLRRHRRLGWGEAAEPPAVFIDSPSCRSASSCFSRGFDGGKKVNGVKVHLGVDKY